MVAVHLTGVIGRAHQPAGNNPGIADIQGVLRQKPAIFAGLAGHIGPGQAALFHCGRPDGKIGFFPG